MSLSKRWLLGGIVAALVVLVAGYLLIISPARDRAAQLNTEADNLNDANQMLSAKLETLQRQSAEVPAKLQEIEAIKRKMPAEMRQPAIVRGIERLAGAAGVDLTAITPAEPTTLETSQIATIVLPVSITATGSYASVKTFVDHLQRQERAFLITSLNVGRAGDSDGSFELSVEGQYFSLPADALATTAAPATEPQAAASAKLPRRR